MENTRRNGKKRMCFRTDVDLSLLALMCSRGAPLQNDFFVEVIIGKFGRWETRHIIKVRTCVYL